MSVLARRPATRPRRGGKDTRIGELFEEHAAMVLAICRYHLRDPQAAEDAAQETFLSAHRSLLGGTQPRDAAAWLATIARNQARRSRQTTYATPFEDGMTSTLLDPAEIVADRADLVDVSRAIAGLPARQREALVLRELWGLSYEQVAAAMSVSAAAVDSLLSRARRRLAEQVGDIPRAAQGALIIPGSLREQLSRLIPELGPAGATAAAGAASGAGGAGLLVNLGSAPVAAKVAAAGATAVALALPVQATVRGDQGHRAAQRPPAAVQPARTDGARNPRAQSVTRRLAEAARSPRPSAKPRTRVKTPQKRESSSSRSRQATVPVEEPSSGSGESGSGSSGSGSGSSGSGSGSSSSGSGSGSSGSGSGSSGSGSGSGDSDSDNSGSGSSGSGSDNSGSGSDSSGSGSSGSGSSGSGSDNSGSGSDSSGSGSSGSGSGGSGSGGGDDDDDD